MMFNLRLGKSPIWSNMFQVHDAVKASIEDQMERKDLSLTSLVGGTNEPTASDPYAAKIKW